MKRKAKRARKKFFVEGFDSYGDEYARWKRTRIVKRLVGIFEISEEQFRLGFDNLPLAVGLHGYSIVQYLTEYDNTLRGDEPLLSAGCTIALRNQYGKIAPVVFVVKSELPIGDGRGLRHPLFRDSLRLLVLLHELGHADDISKGINYDHDQLHVDLAAAEAYAHGFVCKQAQRNGYPLLLRMCLENIERMALSQRDDERAGCERFLKTHDVAAMRSWIAQRTSPEGVERVIEISGRADEIVRATDDRSGQPDKL
jgi:hypothetical protein